MSKGSWKPKTESLERPVTRGELQAELQLRATHTSRRYNVELRVQYSLNEEVLHEHLLYLIRSHCLEDMSIHSSSSSIRWIMLTQTRPTVAPLTNPCLHLFHAGTLRLGSLRSL